MENHYDYKSHYVLYVDDEEKSLKYFREIFGDRFAILTAKSAEEGLKVLQENRDRIAILMTDQRMPGEKGTQFLEKSRAIKPKAMRVLVTAYADMDSAIEAVNTGAIYKYIVKPWDVHQLENTLKRGMEFFIVQNERDQLLREKMTTLYNVMLTDRILSLGLLAAGLNHHIRNSMVAVKTFLDLAPQRMAEENLDLEHLRHPEFWKDFYVKVQNQMDRVVALLGDLWESSERAPVPYSDKVRLDKVVSEALAKVKPELDKKGIGVENKVPADLPELTVDGPKFGRLFEMLLKDEAACLPEKKRIRIGAKLVGPKEGPSEVQVELEDDGPGLPQDTLRSLFDPFFTRSGNPQEFGIHLMSCFFIVHHHGGRITAKPGPNGGTLFTLAFPLAPGKSMGPEEERDFMAKILVNESLWEKILMER